MGRHKPDSTADTESAARRVVVIGNGMVSARFCEKLAIAREDKSLEVTVFGEELGPAYDRVRLSNYVLNRDPSRLELLSREWYEENGIALKTGTTVTAINADKKTIATSDGNSHPYDELVLATGSSPFVPPIPGTDLPNVFVYRNIDDLEEICAAAKGAESAIILGGGLLGLEAAQALQHLEVDDVHVVEMARFLMPQQLTKQASSILEKSLHDQGLRLHLEEQAEEIAERKGRLSLHLKSEVELPADLIIIAAGIRPRDELAREAGLSIGSRGGVRVSDELSTSADNIYAIGECAEHNNRIYGLAAPGFKMAGILASRLGGDSKAAFTGADTSTRLKMLGVDVVTLGTPLQTGIATVHESEGTYRRLLVDNSRKLRGVLCVGPWSEIGQLQAALLQSRKLSHRQLQRFEKTGNLWSDDEHCSPITWPDSAVVCNCMRVTKGTLSKEVEGGCRDVAQLCQKTGAGSVCGSCRPLVAELAGEVIPTDSATTQPKSRLLLWLSSLAVLLVLGIFIFPPFGYADSVTESWYKVDFIWRDFVAKQYTGYGLLALSLIGLLMSLRKRMKWFKLGDFVNWRAFHAAFGVASLIALFAHTGFRFGNNLNFWLMFVFVMLNLLGAFAGIIAALEVRGTGRSAVVARRLRPALTWAHLVLFWPFPILLTFHILSAYLY